MNQLTGRKARRIVRLEGADPVERLRKLEDQFRIEADPDDDFEHLLGSLEVTDPLPIPCSPFTVDELRAAIRRGGREKACGADGLPTEFWELAELEDWVLDLLNEVIVSGRAPEIWKQILIFPVPKKGDLTKAENYRPVCLTSHLMKLYNRLLLERLRP
jgi:hypothetical protein